MVKRTVKIPLAIKKRAAESGEDLEARRAEQPRYVASSFESVTTYHDWVQNRTCSSQEDSEVIKATYLNTPAPSTVRKRALDTEEELEHMQPAHRNTKLPRSKNASFESMRSSQSAKTVVPFGMGVENIRPDTSFPFTQDAVPTCELSFQSEIDDLHRDEIDQNMIPWGSTSFLMANIQDMETGLKNNALLRLPFILESLLSEDQRKQLILDRKRVPGERMPTIKPAKTNSVPSTPQREDEEQERNVGSMSDSESTRDLSRSTMNSIKVAPKPSQVNRPVSPDQDPPIPRPISPQSLNAVTTVLSSGPFLPKDFISATGLGPINLFDQKTGKIIATRHPNGGIGYDPAVNWTPETSFGDGGSKAPSSTLVPIHPGSTLLLPRNRVPQHPKFPYANRESLWGLPGKMEEERDEIDDDTTVVDPEEPLPLKALSDTDDQVPVSLSLILNTTTSFADNIVFRQENDTSFTSPSTKPCSAGANMEDIAEIAYKARDLLASHPGSHRIYASLMDQLEEVVEKKISVAIKETKAKGSEIALPCLREAAVGIRNGLVEKDGRDGEGGLEKKWGKWLVSATERGVMHLKVKGCICRPEPLMADVEYDEEDEEWLNKR